MKLESAITPLRESASQPDMAASGTPECNSVIGVWTPLAIPPDAGLIIS